MGRTRIFSGGQDEQSPEGNSPRDFRLVDGVCSDVRTSWKCRVRLPENSHSEGNRNRLDLGKPPLLVDARRERRPGQCAAVEDRGLQSTGYCADRLEYNYL